MILNVGFILNVRWLQIIAYFLFIHSITGAKVRYVPDEYKTIQSAINASAKGDTVIIAEGEYYENVIINKNIVVASRFLLDHNSSHITNTIIDGSKATDPANSSTILIRGPTDTGCVITGLTIRGGKGSYAIVKRSPIPNKWIFGGGIAIFHASARISKNRIFRNHLEGNALTPHTFGSGIGTVDTSWGKTPPPLVIIEDNLVMENTAHGMRSESAGIHADQSAIIRYNKVLNNHTHSRSRSSAGGIGVILNSEYDVLIFGNYIRHNSAGTGGGLGMGSKNIRLGRVLVVSNIISDNRSFEVAGGVLLSNETYAEFINNTIVNNQTLSTGGAFYIARGAYAVLVNNILWRNSPDQIANLSTTQSFNNLIENGFPGRGNINNDPAFIHGDTLYRLSDESPCISAGRKKIILAGQEVTLLPEDILHAPRINPENTNPDLGAVESETGKETKNEHYQYGEKIIKFFIRFRQITPAKRDPESDEIIKAGEMKGVLQINDDKSRIINHGAIPSFELPPGENLIDLEVVARGRDSLRPLNLFVLLEGADQQVVPYNSAQKIFYHHWANLKPGNYILRIQPQDDESIIGSSNRYAFSITVLPYWYQRWWAYLLYGLIVIAAAFVYTRLRIRNLEKEQALSLRNVEIEKLSELDRLKSRFFANVTHELRTPLTLILGPVETLKEDIKDKKAREQIGMIKRNAYRMLRLVDMLLQFSKVEAGTMKLHTKKQNIIPALTRVMSYFSSQAAKKNVELSFNSSRAEINGYFDEEKIEQIVQNLLSNALKFTAGGGTITLGVSENHDILTVTVSDTGIGIAEEDQKKIFERFYRAESTHKTEGTGIGLSLTKELVELHHGSISVESKLEKGTKVFITMPLFGYAENEIGKDSSPKTTFVSSAIESIQNRTNDNQLYEADRQIILVAEDNDDALEYISSILRETYDVMPAADGAKALEQTRINLPDLVISDVMMPDMDGFELCNRLKTDEKTCHIPIILLTALADRKEKLSGLERGADDYLTKPFDKRELLARIHNLLEIRRKLRESFSHTIKLKPGEVQVVSLDDKFLQRVLKVADEHISEESFTVDQFAHEVFMSRVQFYRKLKAVTNLTPNDFLKIIRLDRAKQLLTDNFGTIAEVAEAVGFGNQSYFTKCFQAQFGILPHEIRKSQNTSKNGR